jgi:3-methyladenine DNA glycosylase AlkD
LVDQSAPYIVGAHLLDKDKDILLTLARSKILWERRVAMVATWYFIRNNQCEWSLKIAKILLADSHDLIHKAVGWMLREVGKKNLPLLIEFLEQNHTKIPRTTLRYAIEKFAEPERQLYLKK